MFDQHVRSLIHDVPTIEQRLERAEIFRQYLDEQWTKFNAREAETFFNWNTASNALKNQMAFIKSRA